jgi:hypothetical protein
MKFTETEVLDIIKSLTDKDPQEVFTNWVVNRKANTPLDLTRQQYNHFVYTFPITVEGKEVGDITLVDLYHNIDSGDDLMLKYFGKEDFDKSWDCFLHDTYLSCYLTIRKEFKLSEICKGMHGDTLQGIDANGAPFQFQISYGDPEEEKDEHYYYTFHSRVDGSYRFDNGFSINVKKMNGWSLGEKINENVEKRLIPYKRAEKLNGILQ